MGKSCVCRNENIEATYRIYWEQLENNERLKDLLALLARLRGPFNPKEWLGQMGEPVIKDLLQHARHYFREETETRWHFFHSTIKFLNPLFSSFQQATLL